MKVSLIDGTYELFRQHYGAMRYRSAESMTTAASVGVLSGVLGYLERGIGHIGVCTDHVIESFRNGLYPGYKTGEGIDPVLQAQFEPLEQALQAMGVATYAMVELEADDGLASLAAVASQDERVTQVVIATPDKDLGQCVQGGRVVQVDRRHDKVIDEPAVIDKFGVLPAQIPDWLALVGDTADGFPGIPGFGAKTAAAVLRAHGHLEDIPEAPGQWTAKVRGASTLAATLTSHREEALLFKKLATLVIDPTICSSVDELRWKGPQPGFDAIARSLGSPGLSRRAAYLATDNTG